MKETRIFNGESMMPISDLYQWVLRELESNSFNERQKTAVLDNLKDYDWIAPLIRGLAPKDLKKLYRSVLADMKQGKFLHAMGYSIMYYHFKKTKIDTKEMRNIINSSPQLAENIESTTFNNLIWKN